MRAMCAITVGQSFKNVPNDKSFKNVHYSRNCQPGPVSGYD